jgi:hypothetical protein
MKPSLNSWISKALVEKQTSCYIKALSLIHGGKFLSQYFK